jgi:hypothetical protein
VLSFLPHNRLVIRLNNHQTALEVHSVLQHVVDHHASDTLELLTAQEAVWTTSKLEGRRLVITKQEEGILFSTLRLNNAALLFKLFVFGFPEQLFVADSDVLLFR